MIEPWRTGMPQRPDLPEPARAFAGRRPLKRWRWVGVFADEVMLCAAEFRLAKAVTVTWWAVWDRRARTLMEDTRRRRHQVAVGEGGVSVDAGPVAVRLTLEPGVAVETISPHGGNPIWTSKRPARASGTVTVAGRRIAVQAPAFVDVSAGYHARATAWRWSAGVGTSAQGADVAWNLVDGLHDAAEASERTVWVDGTPHHVAPQAFAGDLASVGDLAFVPEATRAHREDLLLVASDYEQPFGRFAGSLPVAGQLTGLGVMERHSARW